MLTLLSPAKSLDYSKVEFDNASIPRQLDDSFALVKILKRMSKKKLRELMSVSDALATENKERMMSFSEDFTSDNSKQAILAFNGGVYQGLDATSLDDSKLNWANDHVRILSGLYGVLRPNDLMQAYRLEMGTRLATKRGSNLYAWWGDKITELLNDDLDNHDSKYIFNLASQEYFKSVKKPKLKGELYSANFYELRKGEYKFISFTAKKARGWLCRYIIDNGIDEPDGVKEFNLEGYKYMSERSSDREFIFVRKD